MTDDQSFEARLAASFERYLAAAPSAVDAASLATAVASRSRLGRTARLGVVWSQPRLRLIVVGLVALALAGIGAVVGARLLEHRVETGTGRLVVIAGASETACEPIDVLTHPDVTPVDLMTCRQWALSGDGRYLVPRTTQAVSHASIREIATGREWRIDAPAGQTIGGPTVSPRSTWVAWTTCPLDGVGCVHYMASMRDRIPRIIPGSAGPWTEDERSVVLAIDDGFRLADGDGTHVRVASSAGFWRWSPDGSSYAGVERQDSMSRIVVAPANGGQVRPLTELRVVEVLDLQWAPDGLSLLVVTFDPGDPGSSSQPRHPELQVSIVDIGTRTSTPIEAPAMEAPGVPWSPDGAWLAFETTSGGLVRRPDSQCVIAAADGPQRIRIQDCRAPKWSLDGTELSIETNAGGIDLVNADGTGRRQVLPAIYLGADLGDAPRWVP